MILLGFGIFRGDFGEIFGVLKWLKVLILWGFFEVCVEAGLGILGDYFEIRDFGSNV